MSRDPQSLVERMLGGDRLALARFITHVENRTDAVPAIMTAVHPRAGAAYVVGITGPPGADKSTVADRLTARPRAGGATVGVVAVDPSSPFTGGAGGPRIARPARTTRRAALTAEDPLRNMGWRRPHVHP